MRAPSHHPSGIYRGSERGASAWPLVLALVLLLVFVYLWYAETDKRDEALAKQKDAQEAELQAKNETKRAMDEPVLDVPSPPTSTRTRPAAG